MQTITTQKKWIERAHRNTSSRWVWGYRPNYHHPRRQGARVWDEDGREYVDYLIGSGPMLLGHSHPEVMEAVLEILPKGQTFFANNALGIELAEVICDAMTCGEQLRYVSSGGGRHVRHAPCARLYRSR